MLPDSYTSALKHAGEIERLADVIQHLMAHYNQEVERCNAACTEFNEHSHKLFGNAQSGDTVFVHGEHDGGIYEAVVEDMWRGHLAVRAVGGQLVHVVTPNDVGTLRWITRRFADTESAKSSEVPF